MEMYPPCCKWPQHPSIHRNRWCASSSQTHSSLMDMSSSSWLNLALPTLCKVHIRPRTHQMMVQKLLDGHVAHRPRALPRFEHQKCSNCCSTYPFTIIKVFFPLQLGRWDVHLMFSCRNKFGWVIECYNKHVTPCCMHVTPCGIHVTPYCMYAHEYTHIIDTLNYASAV